MHLQLPPLRQIGARRRGSAAPQAATIAAYGRIAAWFVICFLNCRHLPPLPTLLPVWRDCSKPDRFM